MRVRATCSAPRSSACRAVGVDEERARVRLAVDEDCAVVADRGLLERERVGRRRIREHEQAVDRPVPEELLGGESAVVGRGGEEGHVAEIGVVDVRGVGPEGRVVDVGTPPGGRRKRRRARRRSCLRWQARPASGIATRGKKPVAAATIESPATTIATRSDASPTSPTFCSKKPTARRSGRVALPVRSREARERDPRGERERGAGDQGVGDAMRKSPAHVEGEEERDQRQDREEVALLDPVGAVGRVERRLEDDGERDERAEDGEPELRARARLPEREGKAHQRAGNEHPARRVEERASRPRPSSAGSGGATRSRLTTLS